MYRIYIQTIELPKFNFETWLTFILLTVLLGVGRYR
jgi:hypothetical protein